MSLQAQSSKPDFTALSTPNLLRAGFQYRRNTDFNKEICDLAGTRPDLGVSGRARLAILLVWRLAWEQSELDSQARKRGEKSQLDVAVWCRRITDTIPVLPEVTDPWERLCLIEVLSSNSKNGNLAVRDAMLAFARAVDELKDPRSGAYVRVLLADWYMYKYDDLSHRYLDDSAVRVADEAYELSKQVEDPFPRAQACMRAARVHFELSHYAQARKVAHEGLAICDADKAVERQSVWIPAELIAIEAGSNHYLGNLDVAKRLYERFRIYYAFQSHRFSDVNLGEVSRIFGGYFFLLGNMRLFAEAEAQTKAGIELALSTNRPELSQTLFLAQIYVQYRQKKFADAQKTLSRWEQLASKSTDEVVPIYRNTLRGMVYAVNGRTADAVLEARDGEKGFAIQFPNSKEHLIAFGILFRAYIANGQYAEAAQTGQELVDRFKEMSATVSDPAEVGLFQQTLPNLFGHVAWNKSLLGQPTDAILDLENGRAWGLYRQRSLNSSNYASYLTPSEKANLEAAEAQVRAAVIRLRDLERTHPTATYAADQLRNELTKSQNQLSATWDAVFRSNRLFAGMSKASDATFDKGALEALEAAHPDTLFIHFAMVDEERTLITANSAGQDAFATTIPVGEGDWITKVQEYYRTAGIGSRAGASVPSGGVPAPTIESEQQQARTLYKDLIGPLEDKGILRPNHKRLVFVTDGPLADLPLSPLMDGSGKRLIERYRVSSVVSLGSLNWRQDSRSSGLLCVADPNGKTKQRQDSDAVPEEGWKRAGFGGPLEHALEEGEEVVKTFGHGSKPLFQTDATEKNVSAELEKYAILHFACHGFVESGNPLGNGLILCDDPDQVKDDGLLAVREISRMKLRARLAVLSACETARGRANGGDGIQSLVWAFQAARCPTVVASRWQVDDGSTKDLMVQFYRNLVDKRMPFDAAMQDAALKTMAKHPEPRYWAPFEIFGPASDRLK